MSNEFLHSVKAAAVRRNAPAGQSPYPQQSQRLIAKRVSVNRCNNCGAVHPNEPGPTSARDVSVRIRPAASLYGKGIMKISKRGKKIRARRGYPENYVCRQCGDTFYDKVGADNHEVYNEGHKVVKR